MRTFRKLKFSWTFFYISLYSLCWVGAGVGAVVVGAVVVGAVVVGVHGPGHLSVSSGHLQIVSTMSREKDRDRAGHTRHSPLPDTDRPTVHQAAFRQDTPLLILSYV